jgi:4-diphosphocytidyl-2-C-methyl-D-erythritol kinase
MLLRAFAKINLDLRVLGRRDDGYHEIRTVLQSIDLHDTIRIEPASQFQVRAPSGLEGDDNLVVRAVREFERAAGIEVKARISLEKGIPAGAGLGGGSADAAATILGLERLTGHRLEGPSLLRCLQALGSDVPFFAVGGRAVAAGRGEEVYPLDDDCGYTVLLVVPNVAVRTSEAYSWLTVSTRSPSIEGFCAQFVPGRDTGERRNDFEGPVFERYPSLAQIQAELVRRGAVRAALSGSGSVVFGTFRSRDGAFVAAREMTGDFSTVVAEPLTRAEYFKRMVASD